MSTLSDRERAVRQRLKDDFEHYASRCLRIRTKGGDVVPFSLNRSQRFLHQRLEEQRKRTGMIRALVLKGRQVGISTYICGRFYWRISHSFGYRAFILTHLDTASDNLFGMAKRLHENCPPLVRPETGRSNAKELSFIGLDSGYKVATAGTAEVGRSETIQLFHGSEYAFWPNAQIHAAGIKQAIAAVPGTEDIRESTANGIGNAFHADWKAAERGDSEFEAIFVPWFWHEEYEADPDPGWRAPAAWVDYGKAYELAPAQLYWAWRKNRDISIVAGGSADEPCSKFKQEYPANADEAFQTSGDSFINPARVLAARKAKVIPYGPLILGVDPARGGGDKCGLIDRRGRRIGEHVCKRLDQPDLMILCGEIRQEIKRLRPLGLRKVVVDITGLGAGLYDRLRELEGNLIEGVNFSWRAFDTQKYANRRAEMWDRMRQWLDDPAGVQVPDSDDFQGDICAPVRGKGATHFNSSGQLVLEPKDHIKERLTFSPDMGDAAALTFGIEFGPDIDDDEDWPDERARSSNSTGY